MNANNEKTSQSKIRRASNASRYHRRKAIQRKQKRNQRIVILVSILIVILIGIILLSTKISRKKEELMGVWQYDQYTEYEFLDNGEGCLFVDDVHYEYQYKILGDKLRIDFIEDIVRDCEYSFIIDGNTLTLNGKEGTDGGTYTLKKHQ